MTEELQQTAGKKASKPPSRKETWIRLLYVLLFSILYGVAEIVLGVVVMVQFGFKLITGETNQLLLNFTKGLNKYLFHILQYMTFNANEKPFPFTAWPKA